VSVKTYLISGIATDQRAFSYQYEALPGCVYLPFPAHDKKDTIATYAQKFIPLIDTSEPFNILGHSMGGILTMELIKHVNPQKVILISTIKSRTEMPFKLKQLSVTHFHKLLPGSGFIGSVRFGSKFKSELKKVDGLRDLAVSMAQANDPAFLYWAVNAIVKWKGTDDYRKDIIHIHGTRDEMFPYARIKNAVPVFGGTHVMNMTRAEEVNRLINYYLQQ
jgi:pimeloyl-ACP methyl ester carboxylesterase